jgi:hypothetical protein
MIFPIFFVLFLEKLAVGTSLYLLSVALLIKMSEKMGFSIVRTII